MITYLRWFIQLSTVYTLSIQCTFNNILCTCTIASYDWTHLKYKEWIALDIYWLYWPKRINSITELFAGNVKEIWKMFKVNITRLTTYTVICCFLFRVSVYILLIDYVNKNNNLPKIAYVYTTNHEMKNKTKLCNVCKMD